MEQTDEIELLLDDEVIALALREGKAWPSVTPSLGTLEEEALVQAGRRGVSSLALRRLLMEDADSPLRDPLRNLVHVVLHGRIVMTSFTSSNGGRSMDRANSTVIYEDGGNWVIEVIAPIGAHYLLGATRESVLAQANSMLESAESAAPINAESEAIFIYMTAEWTEAGGTESSNGRVAIRLQPGLVEVGRMAGSSGFERLEASIPPPGEVVAQIVKG